MITRHKILDHTVLGYFILFVFTQICVAVFGSIDKLIAGVIPGYGSEVEMFGHKIVNASGIGNALGAVAALLIFTLWFRPHFKGGLCKEGMKYGLIVVIPVLIISFIGSGISIYLDGLSNIPLALLHALAPGFSEEIGFRGIGIANHMRTVRSGKQIKVIFWLSSVFFGLTHLINASAGADILTSVVQSVFAIGIGMLFGAVYLRTGNLWPTIIAHTAIDFVEFCRAGLGDSVGIMKGMGIGDYIVMFSALVAGVIGFILVREQHYPAIMKVWKSKWVYNDRNNDGDIDDNDAQEVSGGIYVPRFPHL